MKGHEQSIDDRYQKENLRISIALMASFVVTIQYFTLVALKASGTSLASVSKIIVGLLIYLLFQQYLDGIKCAFFATYWLVAFVFIAHYFLFPHNREAMQSVFIDIFFMSLPTFLYAASLDDFRLFRRVMEIATIIVLLFGSLTAVYSFTGRASVGTYSMSLSYYLLLPAIIYMDKLFDKFRIKHLLLFFLSLSIILTLGARGPVMCLAAFFFLKSILAEFVGQVLESWDMPV